MNENYYTINFKDFFKIISQNYLYFVFAGVVSLGFVFVKNQTKETIYSCEVKILPEVNHKSPNGLAGLFEAAQGFSGGRDLYNLEITPISIYLDILISDDFFHFLQKKSPDLISERSQLTKQVFLINQKQKASILRTLAPTPEKAVLINQLARDFLLDYIKAYRTQKAHEDLAFLQNLKIDDISLKNSLIIQQQLIIQDHTPVFKLLNKDNVAVLSTESNLIYFASFLLSQFLALVICLIKDKNYLKILVQT